MNGKQWELNLEKLLKKMCETEKCFFFKSPTPTIMKKNGSNFNFIFSEKAICDFIGLYNKKFILIETKTISAKYWEKRRLKKHQQEQLIKVDELDGKGLIFFYIISLDKIVIFEIQEYLNKIENLEKKNIPFDVILNSGSVLENNIESLILFFQSILLN